MTEQSTQILKLSSIKAVYFIGIGGIGMSALARYFNEKGIRVSGYDKSKTALTTQLEQEGIVVHYNDSDTLIDKDASVVVYTPAVPKEHNGLSYYRSHEYPVLKRSDMLALVTKESYSICVGGTHGKTTTSCMIAHILRHSNYGCSAFLGGIAVNYNTNYWSNATNVTVAEADEYDRSFLKMNPDVAVVTAMDSDHLDIYGTEKDMQDAFVQFTRNIKQGGLLVCHLGIPRDEELQAEVKITYSLTDTKANAYAKNIRVENGKYIFDVVLLDEVISEMQLDMGGKHNIENAIASIAVANHLKIDKKKIKSAIASFRGVKRRFEYVVKNDSMVMIDDYAHHPEELKALLQGVRQMYPNRKCTIVFQPHLYSRTKDLAAGFSEALDMADEILLLPIYPARELPMAGVDSGLIKAGMRNNNVGVIEKNELTDWIAKHDIEVMVMAGAGDIDALVEPVSKMLINKKVHS
jgi:UDP-N-acetylmuramate--alanine ligase